MVTHVTWNGPKSLLTLSKGNTRSHNFKLLKPRVNTNQFLNFYSHRVINKWNSLPSKVVEATSINCFKNRLDHHFKDFKYVTNFDVGWDNGWLRRPFNLSFSRQFLLLCAPLYKEARGHHSPECQTTMLCYAIDLKNLKLVIII